MEVSIQPNALASSPLGKASDTIDMVVMNAVEEITICFLC
jgi:hypothetical protein